MNLLRGGLVLAAALLVGVAGADDKKKADPAAAMEAMMKAGMPGEAHKKLEPLIGDWTYKVKIWFDPSGAPMDGTGTCKRQWILGGRYVREEYKGDETPEPFQGIGVVGYDNLRKKYTSAWIDSMSTGIVTGTATFDATGKTMTTLMENLDPVTGKPAKGRDVVDLSDKNKQTITAFKTAPDGKESKVMEIVLTRKPK